MTDINDEAVQAPEDTAAVEPGSLQAAIANVPLTEYAAIDFDANRVPDEQVASILAQGEQLRKFISSVENAATERMKAGHPIPGLKLVHKAARNTLVNQDVLTEKLIELGLASTLRPQTVTNLLSALKKAVKDGLIEETDLQSIQETFITKPPASVTVAPLDDQRHAVSMEELAADEAEREALKEESRLAVIEATTDAVVDTPAKKKAAKKTATKTATKTAKKTATRATARKAAVKTDASQDEAQAASTVTQEQTEVADASVTVDQTEQAPQDAVREMTKVDDASASSDTALDDLLA